MTRLNTVQIEDLLQDAVQASLSNPTDPIIQGQIAGYTLLLHNALRVEQHLMRAETHVRRGDVGPKTFAALALGTETPALGEPE